MFAEYGSTCDQSEKMLTYFQQSTSVRSGTGFSDQVTTFLNVISRFLSMLKSACKEVQDRRQSCLARGLPDLISADVNVKVNELKLAGGKDKMTSISERDMTLQQRLSLIKTVSEKILGENKWGGTKSTLKVPWTYHRRSMRSEPAPMTV